MAHLIRNSMRKVKRGEEEREGEFLLEAIWTSSEDESLCGLLGEGGKIKKRRKRRRKRGNCIYLVLWNRFWNTWWAVFGESQQRFFLCVWDGEKWHPKPQKYEKKKPETLFLSSPVHSVSPTIFFSLSLLLTFILFHFPKIIKHTCAKQFISVCFYSLSFFFRKMATSSCGRTGEERRRRRRKKNRRELWNIFQNTKNESCLTEMFHFFK